MVKVKSMTSNKGNKVANQFIITDDYGVYFQSYSSMIVFVPNNGDKTQLDRTYWNYSSTTGKYRNEFLSERIAETRKKIETGEYILTDLNK